jgi:peroxiredoxin Q/BCP
MEVDMLEEGELAPDFALKGVDAAGEDVEVRLSELRGRPVVLYFYPKDNTSGCTTQACGIRDEWGQFQRAGATVIGVSPDGLESHGAFSSKYDLPFTLLSDPDHEVAERYGVWKEKKMYGRTYWGIERSTFVIDGDGRLAGILRRVRPKQHVEKVMAVLEP